MCVAAPMKIIKINEDKRTGTVEFSGSELTVNLSLVTASEGDYVLVHAGCAVETVKKEFAEELLGIFAELGAAANGN